MRASIEESLRRRRLERGPLPSIRELAAEFGAAPLTVHRALRNLQAEGIVHGIDRKGYFWGNGASVAPSGAETPGHRFAARFLADLRQGAYHPWKELPSRKSIAQIYQVGARQAGQTLEGLAAAGILERRGRGFFLAPTVRNRPKTSVLVVIRCEPSGALLLDSEREIDFLKSVRRELAELDLGMIRVGYLEEGGGRFLTSDGGDLRLDRISTPLLGAIVSTWLVSDPQRLIDRLEPLKLPLSVWWEHTPAAFPRRRVRAGLAGFNLSFGESAGVAAGRHLGARGLLDVAFVSPYHGNDWSPARLRGLRNTLAAHGGRVRDFVDPSIHSPWDLLRRGGSPSGQQRLLDRLLLGFLDDPDLLAVPTWVLVNDLAATAMHRLLRQRPGLHPHLVSFDNSSDSERIGLDSFEFHTDGMVRLMVHHLENPRAELFADGGLHEMIGRFVLRSLHPTPG